MAQYNYDKSLLKGLGVGAFLGEVKERERHINAAEPKPFQSIYNSNKLAEKLHPHIQNCVIENIIDHGSAKEYVISADKESGTNSLAYFRAGQFLSIVFDIDGIKTCRPYTICSNPKDALSEHSTYSILIKKVADGICSNYALNNWQVGTKILTSGPVGHYYYTSLRDPKHIVALAGGSGITPFYSMACAIAAGIEDFKLTILYGSRLSSDILLKDKLDELEKQIPDKLKVVHIISDENVDGYEHGFITSDIIKKYAGGDDYCIYLCGPAAMQSFISKEIEKLNLPKKRIRLEVPGEILDVSKFEELKDVEDDVTHKITVHIRDEVKEVTVKENVNLMRGLENAGIFVPSDCRSGRCGWCRSRLISGKVCNPNSEDFRRKGDKKFGWVHLCVSYAKSDCELEVFPII